MKGVIYFQAIEEVYYDHLKNAHKVSCKNDAVCYNNFFLPLISFHHSYIPSEPKPLPDV